VNARAGLLAALDVIELTSGSYEHDHNYETGCRDYEVVTEREIGSIADDLLAELGRRGWMLVRVDPFVSPKPPSGCCGGWIDPDGQRSMCCPLADHPSDEALAAALDVFQEAAESYGYGRTGGSAGGARRSRERLHSTRIALVRLVTGGPRSLAEDLTSATNPITASQSEAVFEAHQEDTGCPGPCETHHPANGLAARVEQIERYLDGRTSTEPYSWRDA
jgi:hypothetical protein